MGLPKKHSSGPVKFIKVVFVIGVLLAIFVAGATAMLPSDYEVKRSVEIDAEPDEIHALVGDLKRWPEWDAWKDEDPTIKVTLGEKTEGVGASQSWTGKDGNGSITFTGSNEKGIDYEMAIGEGDQVMKSTGTITYSAGADGKTRVTWTFKGEVGWHPIGRFIAWRMDDMVGPVFEKGLKKMKTAAEAE